MSTAGSRETSSYPDSTTIRETKYALDITPIRYNIYTIMEFEFDEEKSHLNKEKHGIDFMEAQQIWDDPEYIEIPARTTDEPRILVVGVIAKKHWSAVITCRIGKIRIISVRRSREEEIQMYES